jgi:hypothetical protein
MRFSSETKRTVVYVKAENKNVVKIRTMLLKPVGPKGVGNETTSPSSTGKPKRGSTK